MENIDISEVASRKEHEENIAENASDSMDDYIAEVDFEELEELEDDGIGGM